MFSLNQKVVYPSYGVAYVSRVFEKDFGAQTLTFCELKFLNLDMTVMIPMKKAEEMGIRTLSSIAHIDAVFKSIKSSLPDSQEYITVNWNKRSKSYANKLKSGSFEDAYAIYYDLMLLSKTKQLSFGETNLLQKIEMLLVEEIAAVKNFDITKTIYFLRSLVTMPSNSIYVSPRISQYQL